MATNSSAGERAARMRFSINEVSTAASGSSTRHGTLKSAGMTPSAASSCNALSRRPPAVTAWTPFSPGEGCTTRFCLSPRARMLAFSSASSAAEGGVLRTLVGDGTSLSSGMFRTADGVVVMCGFFRDGRARAVLLPCRHVKNPLPVLSLLGVAAGTVARKESARRPRVTLPLPVQRLPPAQDHRRRRRADSRPPSMRRLRRG